MKNCFCLLKNNLKYLAQNALKIAFGISTVASIYEIAIGKIIDNKTNIYIVLGILVLIFVILYLLSFIGSFIWIVCKKSKVIFATDKHSVSIHFGDLLNNNIVNDKSKIKNIIINVNRCFDTIVNNELISNQTLHGQIFKNLYSERKYDETSLQKCINNSLKEQEYELLQQKDKPQGNLKRYSVGTIVKIEDTDTRSYFLLGMSSFDKNLNAHTSKEDFILSIQRLIEYCDKNSQGNAVLLPLLGSSLSRTGINSYTDNLKYIIAALRINKEIINCDFRIFIKPDDKHKINFGDL